MDNITLIRVVSGLLVVFLAIAVPVYVLVKRRKESAIAEAGGPGDPYVSPHDSDRFVIPRGAVLPSRCVKCGNTPTEPWLEKTFSWHNPALLFLLFLGLWPYVIVAALVQKKIKLAVPLCDACMVSRKKRLRIGIALLLTCIPVPWAITYLINGAETAILSAILLGVVMFVAGLMFTVFESPLRATRIGRDSAEFKGACPDFLASLQFSARSRVFGVGQQS
jgi:hypothetical protein